MGPVPVEGDGSVSVPLSLSWRRRLAEVDGGGEGGEVRVGLVGREEGPGTVMG
jgi:hypothetical protein